MKTSASRNRLSRLILVFAVTGAPYLRAQNYDVQNQDSQIEIQPDQSIQQSQQALTTAQGGDFSNGLAIAHTALEKCPTGVFGTQCRALLNYTLGYVLQDKARSASSEPEQKQSLNAASDSYN